MAALVKFGAFNSRVGTGAQAITGVGFQPKGLIIFSELSTGFTDYVWHVLGMASYDGAVLSVVSGSCTTGDNLGTSDAESGASGADVIIGVSFSSGLEEAAALSSMDADGFTLNWTTNLFGGSHFFYVAFGGSDVTCKLGSFVGTNSNVPNAQAVTGLGFQPDTILAYNYGWPKADSSGGCGLGMCGTDLGQGVYKGWTRTGATPRWRAQVAATFLDTDNPTGAITRQGRITSLDADGFSVYWDVSSLFAYTTKFLAIQGLRSSVGTLTQPGTTGAHGFDPGVLNPIAALFFSVNAPTNTAGQSDHRVSLGGASINSSVITQGAIWHGSQAGANPTIEARFAGDADAIMLATEAATGSASTVNGRAQVTAFNPSSIDLNWSVSDAGGREIYYLAFGLLASIVILPTSLPNGSRGVLYDEALTASGGAGAPYTWSVSAGALPAGLVLASDGSIVGIPTTAGVYTFTIRATDGAANTGERAYSITIGGLRIVIDGIERIEEISDAEIDLPLNRQATATLTFGDGWIPDRAADVMIYARDGVTELFGGIVLARRIQGMSESSPANKGTAECVDYSVYFDDADPVSLVSTVTEDLEDVIASIVAQSLDVYGITYTPTATGITVPPRDWTEITVPDAFKRITDATGIVFRVLPSKELRVFRPLDDPAPATITDANINAFDLSWSDPQNLPRNTVDLLCGPTGNGVTSQLWTADGIETSWEVDIQAVIGDYFPGARAHAFLGPVGAGNFSAGDTIGLGSSTYTMRAALVGDVAGDVLIGANINASLANLAAAIVGAGGGVYAPSTPINADADGYMRYPDQLAVNALAVGVAGNAIAVSSSNGAIAFWYGEGTIPLSTLQLGADPAGAAGWTQGYIVENGATSVPLGGVGTGTRYEWDVTDGRGTVSIGAGAAPAAGTVLQLSYLAVFPFHAKVPASLAPGTPPITFREAHPEIVSYADGIALATQILVRESEEARQLEIFTDVDGFLPGQDLTVNTTYRGGLVSEFLVASVHVTMVNADLWEYRISAQETDEYAGSYVEQWKALTSGGSSSASTTASTLTSGGPTIGAGDIYSDGRTSFRANQSMGGNKLTFVDDPASAQDAATKAYTDAGDAAALADAETYADAGDVATLATVAADHYIKRDGTIAFTGDQSMGSNKITNVTDPTSAQDAATKAYVDAAGGGGGGAGALVLLESHTASGSAALDFTTRNATGQSGATFQSDYDEYVVEFVNVVPATNAVNLGFRVSTDGGATYISTTSYRYAQRFTGSAGGTGISNSNSIGLVGFSGLLSSTASAGGSCGHLRIFNPLSASMEKIFRYANGFKSSDGNYYYVDGVAVYAATTAVNALRFLMDSGNITSGTIRLYGVAK